eukprot:jgi/Bigna1/86642/estExt_fgenesh1_pg.C_120128
MQAFARSKRFTTFAKLLRSSSCKKRAAVRRTASRRNVAAFSTHSISSETPQQIDETQRRIDKKTSATRARSLVSLKDDCDLQNDFDETTIRYVAWAYVERILEHLKDPSVGSDGEAIIRAFSALEFLSQGMITSLKDFSPKSAQRDSVIDSLHCAVDTWRSLFLKRIFPRFDPEKGEARSNLFDLQSREATRKLIQELQFDQEIGEASETFKHIEVFFRGSHQICEVVFWVQRQLLKRFQVHQEHRDLCLYSTNLTLLGFLFLLNSCGELNDIYEYARYRPALTGTSGAGSFQLRFLKRQTDAVFMSSLSMLEALRMENSTDSAESEGKLFGDIEGKTQKISALSEEEVDRIVDDFALLLSTPGTPEYDLALSVHSLVTSDLLFWNHHAMLAACSIGLNTHGTMSMSVSMLFKRINQRLNKSTMLKALSEVSSKIEASDPENHWITVDYAGKRLGKAIFEKLDYSRSREVRQKIEVDQKDILSSRYVEKSLYRRYFEWEKLANLNEYLRFETFGSGLHISSAPNIVAEAMEKHMLMGNDIWGHYFESTLPRIQSTVLRLLDLPEGGHWTVTEGANTTEFLPRIFSSALSASTGKTHIVTTDSEFLAADRAFAERRDCVSMVPFGVGCDFKKTLDDIAALVRSRSDVGLVFLSQVYSNTQASLTEKEFGDFLGSIPAEVAVCVDVTQGFCNTPFSWGNALGGGRTSPVYITGTFVKHGRAGEGVGFLAHPRVTAERLRPQNSGWTACLSGLGSASTRCTEGRAAFDQGLEWRGGTPANFAHLELAVHTWDTLLFKENRTLSDFHEYVQDLIKLFLDTLDFQGVEILNRHNLLERERRKAFPHRASNALVFDVGERASDLLDYLRQSHGVVCDCRNSRYVRVGFGIEHGPAQVQILANAISSYEEGQQK